MTFYFHSPFSNVSVSISSSTASSTATSTTGVGAGATAATPNKCLEFGKDDIVPTLKSLGEVGSWEQLSSNEYKQKLENQIVPMLKMIQNILYMLLTPILILIGNLLSPDLLVEAHYVIDGYSQADITRSVRHPL